MPDIWLVITFLGNKLIEMILRYIIWIIAVRFLMGFVGNIFVFPIAWVFKKWTRKRKWFLQTLLWFWLHDGSDYGDPYFLEKYKNKKNFWTAWNWAFRNPSHNFYYKYKITGKQENFKGWSTTQENRPLNITSWRTLLTRHDNGRFAHKYGRWIDAERSILGKQKITFTINGKKYFRYSVAMPYKLWKNLYWVSEFKFGFENVNWAIQLHLFEFKRYDGEFKYKKLTL